MASKHQRSPVTGRKGRENPSPSYEAAAELARDFHGRENRDSRLITKEIKFPANVAELAYLEGFAILIDENRVQDIMFDPEEVALGCTPNRTQLTLEPLVKHAMRLNVDELVWLSSEERKKQYVMVGEVFEIYYFADKHHLVGPKAQAKGSSYRHEFGEKTGIRPVLMYDALSELLTLVGGAYEVRDVGIVG